ncbi:hypothetical protein LguiB_002987 [Lonicera macranthoides]
MMETLSSSMAQKALFGLQILLELYKIQNSFAQLLYSGNLVLRETSDLNAENSLWQCFDYPSDKLVRGRKLGWNLTNGHNRYLTSWKGTNDPSIGEYTYGIEIVGLPQGVTHKKSESEKRFHTGACYGLRFSGISMLLHSFRHVFVTSTDETYYMFECSNSIILRDVLNQLGTVDRYVLSEGSSEWVVTYRKPSNICDNFGQYCPNGICRMQGSPTCECLKGFVPKKQSKWDFLVRFSGCVRSTPLNCQQGDGFVKLKRVKSPDLLRFWLNKSMDLDECKAECLKNCSCMALANSDIRDRGSGCLIWFGDLIDIREFSEETSEQDIYLRLPASLLASENILQQVDQWLKYFRDSFPVLFKLEWDLVEEKEKRGYMSPKYAVDGKFSVKSVVFSFGVLMIEIVSGKKNNRLPFLQAYMDVMVFVERWKGLGTSGSMFEGFIYRISSSEMLSTRSIVRAEIPERQANYVSSGFDVRIRPDDSLESLSCIHELDSYDYEPCFLLSTKKFFRGQL